jgi:DNA modification methylase
MPTLLLGNCLEKLAEMPDCSIDAIVTDPPYGLSFMGKKWDYDVPGEDIWRECLRVLKPGGHLLAFAGTRTQHRMAVRIEDAGFEIRDMIAWAYGSGFPKSMDVSKAIDKAEGAEREVIVERMNIGQIRPKNLNGGICDTLTPTLHGWQPLCPMITAPATA